MHIAASTVGAGAHRVAVGCVRFMAARRCWTARGCPRVTLGRPPAPTAYGRGCPAPSGIAGDRTVAWAASRWAMARAAGTRTAGGCGCPWSRRVTRCRTVARATGTRTASRWAMARAAGGCPWSRRVTRRRPVARAAGTRTCSRWAMAHAAGSRTMAGAAGGRATAHATVTRSPASRSSCRPRWCRRRLGRSRRRRRCRGLLLVSVLGGCREAGRTQDCQN